MNKIEYLLDEVSKTTLALRTAQILYNRKLAPQFNIFNYINTNELGLSLILADLLNPNGSHAQQAQFLLLFLKFCLPTIEHLTSGNFLFKHIENTKVSVEEVTYKSGSVRRMDIYLRCQAEGTDFGICIENKPYAIDQEKQLEDYAVELQKRHGNNWHIVYLNEYFDKPNEKSVSEEILEGWTENNKFSALKYSQLIHWLKACQIECQNQSVTEFISQLIKFIQKQFMGIEDMNETNMIVDIMQRSPDTLESSFKIANSINSMKKQLIEKLKTDLKNGCSDSDEYEIDVSYIGEGKRYEQINLNIKESKKYYISFEFQGPNFNQPYVGIKFNSLKDALNCPYKLQMKEILENEFPNKKIDVSDLWPAGYWFDPVDWEHSHIPWMSINNGEMATRIFDELKSIYMILKEEGCLRSY